MDTVEIAGLSTEKVKRQTAAWRDSLGIVASIGCAIHCAAMPFVIAYLPALGLSFLADEGFHQWMAVACFLIAIAAFLPGIKKHKNLLPVTMGGVGLVLITFAAFGLEGECCPSCEEAVAVASTSGDSACDQCQDCQTLAAPATLELSCDQCEDCQTLGVAVNSELTCEQCEDCETVVTVPAEAKLVCDQCDECQTIAAEFDVGNVGSQTVETPEKTLLSKMAPWITPFGALLLVAAHFYNRRYGYLCACC